MRVISRRALREFWEDHPPAEGPLRAWLTEVENAAWRTPADVKKKYRSASILNSDQVVFNIGGNRYRLVVVVKFAFGLVYIRFVGTHAEYDRIDATRV